MESFVTLLIPGIVALLLMRIVLMPLRWGWKLLANSACGFLCLWLLNAVSAFTGVLLPMNAVTVGIAGFLGLPGVALVALLAIL